MTIRRRSSLSEVQQRIPKLLERARRLAEKETTLRERARALSGRRQARVERRVERVAAERAKLVTGEFGAILEVLAAQSKRTREHLDRVMTPVVDVALEWGEIERTFELLDEAVAAPEVAGYVTASRGSLSVPAFPVREADGYVVPFPRDAFVF
jgi:hypothetical protein